VIALPFALLGSFVLRAQCKVWGALPTHTRTMCVQTLAYSRLSVGCLAPSRLAHGAGTSSGIGGQPGLSGKAEPSEADVRPFWINYVP